MAKRSLHMDGKAIDIRLPGIALSDLRDAALSLKAGGVGFMPTRDFVHIDTGKIRLGKRRRSFSGPGVFGMDVATRTWQE